jgi:hypothetical protein
MSNPVRTVAKYAIVSCIALAAVFVVIKKMKPTKQLQRLRELKQDGGGVFSGGSTKSEELMTELKTLRGEGGSKETHTIMMLGVLFVSAFATVQLGGEIFSG